MTRKYDVIKLAGHDDMANHVENFKSQFLSNNCMKIHLI